MVEKINGYLIYFESNPRVKIVKKELKGLVLDIGCGESNFHELLEAKNIKIVGMDKRYSENVDVISDIKLLPFKLNSFDTIHLGEVIEHIETPFECLLECRKLLKKNGKIIITTQNMLSLGYIRRRHQHEHIMAWNDILLSRLVERAGFRVKKRGFIDTHAWYNPFKYFCKIFSHFKWHVYVIGEKIDK